MKRIWRNVAANAYGQVGQAFLQLAIVPLFILAWGVNRYGDWLLLSTIPSYLATSDLGFISVSANEMASAMARGDQRRARRVYQSSWLLTSGLSVVFASAFLIIIIALDPSRALALNTLDAGNAALVLLLLALYAVAAQQSSLTQAGLRAVGRNPTGVFTMNTVRILETVVAAGAALAGGTVLAAAGALLGVRLLGLAWQFLLLQHHSPLLRLGLDSASLQTLKSLVRPSLAFFIMPLGNALSLQVFLVVLAHGVEREALVAFSLTRTLSRLGTQIVGVLEASLLPEVSVAYGLDDTARLRALHDRACGVSFYLALVMAVGLVLLTAPFMQLWTAGRVDPPTTMVVLLALDVVITSLWSTSAVVPFATNRLGVVATGFVLCSMLQLAVLLPLAHSIGIAGAPLAMCIGDLLMIPITLVASLRMTRGSFRQFATAFSPRSVLQTARLAMTRRHRAAT